MAMYDQGIVSVLQITINLLIMCGMFRTSKSSFKKADMSQFNQPTSRCF